MRVDSYPWKRDSPFILTYTGEIFKFKDVCPDTICIEDIAHSLSHLCRYTGHTNMFYSVAQHSLLVSEKMPNEVGPEEKLGGLLHDAAEAYIGDMSTPLKFFLRDEKDRLQEDFMLKQGSWNEPYGHLQDYITRVIYEKYGIVNPSISIRSYDKAALVFEVEGFMGLSEVEMRQYGFPVHLRGLWQPWEPKEFAARNSDREFGEVETEFIERFEILMKAVGREELI